MSYLVGGTQKSVVTLSTADLLALHTTPINLTPTPPAGFVVMPQLTTMEYIAGSVPFGFINGTGVYFIQVYNGRQPSTGLDGGYSSALIVTSEKSQVGTMGAPLVFNENIFGGYQPIGSYGPSQSSPMVLTLTSAENNDGSGNTTYHGTITGGRSGIPYNGYTFTVAGFTNSNNNGTFLVHDTGSSTWSVSPTTILLENPNGAAETHAATATLVNQIDGKALQIKSKANLNGGGLLTATVASGGTGYNVGDTGIVQGGGFGAVYQVTAAPGNVVTTVSIIQPGNDYEIGGGAGISTAVPTQIGGGGDGQPGPANNQTGTGNNGLTLNVGTIQKGNGSLVVTTYYSVVPL